MTPTEAVLTTLLEKLDEIGIEAGVSWEGKRSALITFGTKKFTVDVREGWHQEINPPK